MNNEAGFQNTGLVMGEAHGTVAALLHELRTHQLELEMQNEQLRQSQIELEKSRDRYVDFYDFAPVGYLTLDQLGMITEINLTGATLLGVVRSKLLHHRFAPFIAPNDRMRWDKFLLSLLKFDKKQSCELSFQHADKSCLYAQLDCQQLKNMENQTRVRVCLTDITERKMLEKSKQEVLERFQRMSRLSPAIIYQFRQRFNGSLCMPYVSEAFYKIFRLQPSQVRQDAAIAFALVHPDDLEGLLASSRESARLLTPWQHEFRVRHADGTIFWLRNNTMPEREAGGSTLWHGSLTDITERKLAEQIQNTFNREIELRNEILKLIIQDKPLAEIVDSLVQKVESLHPDIRCAVMLLDEQHQYLRLCSAPGMSQAFQLNMACQPLSPGNCSCQQAVLNTERVVVPEVLKHGCKLTQQAGIKACSTQPIRDGEGVVHGTLTFFYPQQIATSLAETISMEHYANLVMMVIERDQARQVLHSQQELKTYQMAARRYASHLEAMREEEKNRFAREMHDDLGSALTAIRMEAYLLSKKLPANDQADSPGVHTTQVMKLIDVAIADMRRIIIGLRPSILDDFGLQEALEWHAEQFHLRNGIECKVSCSLDEDCEHELGKNHPINLFRIFQEALTNVARHADASLVEVTFLRSAREIILSICDNGSGIPKEHTLNPGSFGMMGMQERAVQMGGKISFENRQNGGLCVKVIIPLQNAAVST